MNWKSEDECLKKLLDNFKKDQKEFNNWVKETALEGIDDNGYFVLGDSEAILRDWIASSFGNYNTSPDYVVDGNFLKLSLYTNEGNSENIEWDLKDTDFYSNADNSFVTSIETANDIQYGAELQLNRKKPASGANDSPAFVRLDKIFSPESYAVISGSGTSEDPYIITDDYTKMRVLAGLPIALRGPGSTSDKKIFQLSRIDNSYGATIRRYTYMYPSTTPTRVTFEEVSVDYSTWKISTTTVYVSANQ